MPRQPLSKSVKGDETLNRAYLGAENIRPQLHIEPRLDSYLECVKGQDKPHESPKSKSI